MKGKLTVTSSPHMGHIYDTRQIMRDVLIALCPALIAACLIFGMRSLVVTVASAGFCVLFEHLFCLLLKAPTSVGDLSAVVTGVLLAYNLPVTIPVYMVAIGAFVAIVVVKMLFGGLGNNFANPAIAARIVLLLSFPARMVDWAAPFSFGGAVDTVASATPLAVLKFGEGTLPSLFEMFVGGIPGCIGEVSAAALLLGFIYLLVRRVIKPITPVIFAGVVFLLSAVIYRDLTRALYETLGGGLLLGAIFMATDYTTSPLTDRGKVIFAVGCGLITVAIRMWGTYTEGVSFAILLMNLLVPYIDRISRHKAMGGVYDG